MIGFAVLGINIQIINGTEKIALPPKLDIRTDISSYRVVSQLKMMKYHGYWLSISWDKILLSPSKII